MELMRNWKSTCGKPDCWISATQESPVWSRQAFDLLQKDFTVGKTSPINIIVQRPEGKSIWDAESIARVYRLSRVLHADPRVTKVEGVVDVDPKLTLTEYQTLYSQESGLSDSGNIFAQMIGSYVGGEHKESTVLRVTTGYEANSASPGRWYGRFATRSGRRSLAAPAIRYWSGETPRCRKTWTDLSWTPFP